MLSFEDIKKSFDHLLTQQTDNDTVLKIFKDGVTTTEGQIITGIEFQPIKTLKHIGEPFENTTLAIVQIQIKITTSTEDD